MPDWQLQLGDLTGTKISAITRVGLNRKLEFRLMRPQAFSFEVPADDAAVADLHSDGRPFLSPGRTVQGWRAESGGNVLRFSGYVWQTTDVGDPDMARTRVLCLDASARLRKRFLRNGANARVQTEKFTDTDPAQIVKALIDRTNSGGGACGVTTSAGTFDAFSAITITLENQSIDSVMRQLAASFALEWLVEPITPSSSQIAKISVRTRVGTDRDDSVLLAWAAPGNAAASVQRLFDMETLANDIVGAGDGTITSSETDATSITTYGRYEDGPSLGDITDQAVLDAFVDTMVLVRKNPREEVHLLPQTNADDTIPEVHPWDDFDLGDTIAVAASERLRGGFTGVQRIYGWDVDLDDEAVERVSRLYVSSEV